MKNSATIDHIAIAVPNLEAALTWYVEVLGFEISEQRITNGNQTGMKSAVLQFDNVKIVLIQGLSQESQVSKYIEKYGPGVQHIAIRVDDIVELVSTLQSRGLEFSTGIIDAPGLRQIFTRRDQSSGVMLEVIETNPDRGFDDGNVKSLYRQLEESGDF